MLKLAICFAGASYFRVAKRKLFSLTSVPIVEHIGFTAQMRTSLQEYDLSPVWMADSLVSAAVGNSSKSTCTFCCGSTVGCHHRNV